VAGGRELVVARYPLFAAELDDAFAEADFLRALRAEAAHRYGAYSHGGATVARFRGRLGDGALRAGLASLFGVRVADLDATCHHVRERYDEPAPLRD
jgi:hypothetical protein